MKLRALIVGDPKRSIAELVAKQCERLARTCAVATTEQALMENIYKLRPELLILALELPGLPIRDLIRNITRSVPQPFIILTYRELSLPEMQHLSALGVEEFISHPIDVVEIFRAASRRFRTPFRRHARYAVNMEVHRADGVVIGQALDISEGGIRFVATHSVSKGDSLLVDLALDGGQAEPFRVRCQVLDTEKESSGRIVTRLQFTRLWGQQHRRLVLYLESLGNEAIV